MGAPYTFLNFAVEDAFCAYLKAKIEGTGLNFYRQMDATAFGVQIVEPFIGVACQDGSPESDEMYVQEATSQRRLQAMIVVRSHAEDSMDATDLSHTIQQARDAHRLLVGQVFDALGTDGLVGILNGQGVPNLIISAVDVPKDTTQPVNRSYETTITFGVSCYATNA